MGGAISLEAKRTGRAGPADLPRRGGDLFRPLSVRAAGLARRYGMDTLLRPEAAFDPDSAWQLMQERIVNRLMTTDDIAALQRKAIPRSGE